MTAPVTQHRQAAGMLLRGALETLAVVAAFLVFGLACALVRAPGAAYAEGPVLWLVDGYNVLHASLLGGRDRSDWWTGPRRAELLARVAGFDDPDDPRAEVEVVFDGPGGEPDTPEQAADPVCAAPRRVFAPDADAWVLRRVREAVGRGGAVAVVTADRRLAERARRRGARVVPPGDFLTRCGS